ncbi:hypothetical protein ACWENS_05570 [Streptomyces sp. NPDC004532]
MRLPVIRVQMDRRTTGRGRVIVDGRELPGVRSVEVRHEVSQRPRVIVEFNALEAPVEYLDVFGPALDDDGGK